jgi:hypothetical protein
MSDGFRGTIDIDIRDSVPDWERTSNRLRRMGLRTSPASTTSTSSSRRSR